MFYTFVGGFSALVNLLVFVAAYRSGVNISVAALSAFFIAALVNYLLSIKLIFRHNAKWRTPSELLVYFLVVSLIGVVDLYSTVGFVSLGSPAWLAKVWAIAIGLILNFSVRRFIVFPEAPNPDWKAQNPK